MIKYFWHGEGVGFSEDFNNFEDCEEDAVKDYKKYPFEHDLYSYDTDEFPNGEFECAEDCNYIGFIGVEF